MNKFPWIEIEALAQMLEVAADKIERGEPLTTGDAGGGGKYLERDVVVEVLRAAAAQQPLGPIFRSGRPPHREDWKLWHKVAMEERRLGSKAKAFAAISVATQRSPAAVKKAYQRLVTKERESFRETFLSGHWPGDCWNMTDAEIDEMVKEDAFQYVDAERRPIDMGAHWRARRQAELDEIKKLTGWKELPPVPGQ